LDKAFVAMGLKNHEVCMVSDIGCSGFFDVFFDTHAFHGLHGRALTYAAGIKLCRPDLSVVVTMGDGGVGIGGAHLIAACRRNLDLTLLVLNNFNFGMTGGQCSVTTPEEAIVGSGFLNKLEKPLDLASLAISSGAAFVCRCSAYQKDLPKILEQAVRFKGFSIVEIQGTCPGRYTAHNRLTPKIIAERLAAQGPICGPIPSNQRPEYGEAYQREAMIHDLVPRPSGIETRFTPPQRARHEISLLGEAGQHVITAGEILALAGLTAGMHVTQRNEHNVTVLRGPSISEIVLAPDPIDYCGTTSPSVVIALSGLGVNQRVHQIRGLRPESLVVAADGVRMPPTSAEVRLFDFRNLGIGDHDWSLASLGVLASLKRVLSREMLVAALESRFESDALVRIRDVVERVFGEADSGSGSKSLGS
jgi:pyruvate/2-oxoacid:ferredoxin oxidoreductase beta subunit